MTMFCGGLKSRLHYCNQAEAYLLITKQWEQLTDIRMFSGTSTFTKALHGMLFITTSYHIKRDDLVTRSSYKSCLNKAVFTQAE